MSLRDIWSCTLTNMLFIIAQNSMCSLCSGTTQDIPAGFYQPEFQDTASQCYGASAPAKNIYAHTHACKYTPTHITHTCAHTQLRQRWLLQTQKEKQACKRESECKAVCIQNQEQISHIRAVLFRKNSSCATAKSCACKWTCTWISQPIQITFYSNINRA